MTSSWIPGRVSTWTNRFASPSTDHRHDVTCIFGESRRLLRRKPSPSPGAGHRTIWLETSPSDFVSAYHGCCLPFLRWSYLNRAGLVVGNRTHGVLVNSNSQLDSFPALGNLFIVRLVQFQYWNWTMGGRVRLTDVVYLPGCSCRGLGEDTTRLARRGDHFALRIVGALEHGLRIVEVAVTFSNRLGVSKGGNAGWFATFTLGLPIIWHILTYRVARTAEVSGSPSDELTHALFQ